MNPPKSPTKAALLKAEKRIEAAASKSAIELYGDGLGLIQIPESIRQLTHLEVLYLARQLAALPPADTGETPRFVVLA